MFSRNKINIATRNSRSQPKSATSDTKSHKLKYSPPEGNKTQSFLLLCWDRDFGPSRGRKCHKHHGGTAGLPAERCRTGRSRWSVPFWGPSPPAAPTRSIVLGSWWKCPPETRRLARRRNHQDSENLRQMPVKILHLLLVVRKPVTVKWMKRWL